MRTLLLATEFLATAFLATLASPVLAATPRSVADQSQQHGQPQVEPQEPRERAARPVDLQQACADVAATARESRWQLVPWRRSLKAALAEAERTGKPVWYFGADGDFWTGNC